MLSPSRQRISAEVAKQQVRLLTRHDQPTDTIQLGTAGISSKRDARNDPKSNDSDIMESQEDLDAFKIWEVRPTMRCVRSSDGTPPSMKEETVINMLDV